MKPARYLLSLTVLLFAFSMPALAEGGTMETPPAPAAPSEPGPTTSANGTMETPPVAANTAGESLLIDATLGVVLGIANLF